MKKVDVVTCFPQEFLNFIQVGLVGESLKKNIWNLNVHNLRDYGEGNHHAVDDKPFGGGDGMVLTATALEKVLCKITSSIGKTKRLYLSPQGHVLNQTNAKKLALEYDHFIFLCGRYSGVDQRLLSYFDFQEISIGDYILSGGELAAAVTLDVMARNWEGVLGNYESAIQDSFSHHECLLEGPLFTRPRKWNGLTVPEALLSGHHGKISEWQSFMSYLITFQKRPDLFHQLRLDRITLKNLLTFASQLTESDLRSTGILPKTLMDLKQELPK